MNLETEVRGRLDSVRAGFDPTGPTVVDALCKVTIRLAREIDTLRAELAKHHAAAEDK